MAVSSAFRGQAHGAGDPLAYITADEDIDAAVTGAGTRGRPETRGGWHRASLLRAPAPVKKEPRASAPPRRAEHESRDSAGLVPDVAAGRFSD